MWDSRAEFAEEAFLLFDEMMDQLTNLQRECEEEMDRVVWTKHAPMVDVAPHETLVQFWKLPRVMKSEPKLLRNVYQNFLVDDEPCGWMSHDEIGGFVSFLTVIHTRTCRHIYGFNTDSSMYPASLSLFDHDSNDRVTHKVTVTHSRGIYNTQEYDYGNQSRITRVWLRIYRRDHSLIREGWFDFSYDNQGHIQDVTGQNGRYIFKDGKPTKR